MKLFPTVLLFYMLLSAFSTAGADTFRFKADRMSGGKATGKEITVLSGNAEVRSEDLHLTADRMELSGDDNRFIDCVGNVRGVDDKKGIHFSTDRLRYDRTLKIARLEGDSTLEDKENGVVSKARFVEYEDESGVSVLQVAVRIFKDKMICRSEYALYRRTEKTLALSGFPVVYKDGDEFRADRIRVDLETDDVIMEGAVQGSIREKKADGDPKKP